MTDQTLDDWLSKLGSKTSTPGGGAVAGLNGAIAAAQLKMVCEYTRDNLRGELDLAKEIQLFLDLSDQDSQAYLKINEAYKSKDNDMIQQALFNATLPSNKIAVNCDNIYKFCQHNLSIFNKNLLSDLIVALANLTASVESAQAMLSVNAKSMDDSDNKRQTLDQINFCEGLISKINGLRNKVRTEMA